MQPTQHLTWELVDQWLAKAEEDFGLAEHLVATGAPFPSAVAFHAQQAAEKYLKALLVRHQREFPKIHDMAELLDLLGEVDPATAASLAELDVLTPYSVEARYPGDFPAVTAAEAGHALALAREARATVAALLQGARPATPPLRGE